MMRLLAALALFALVACLGNVATTGRAAAQSPAFDDGQVREIEEIVRDYLIANPEVLRDVFDALDAKDEKERQAKLVAAIAEHGDRLFNNPDDIVLGNPDGAVTMVEFFDYNCGYCKRALTDLATLLQTDPNLRVVLKEFPILTDGSIEAARVSIAVSKQATAEQFFAFHSRLLTSRGANDGARALEVAESLEFDMDRLRADMALPETEKHIEDTKNLAIDMGIDGTPAYIIGNVLVPGAVGVDGLREAIEKARATD